MLFVKAKKGCRWLGQQRQSGEMGYSEDEMNDVPTGSNLGLGCGNPVAIASLKSGESVLDLGSGAGFDAFLAVRKVGKEGRVIGKAVLLMLSLKKAILKICRLMIIQLTWLSQIALLI